MRVVPSTAHMAQSLLYSAFAMPALFTAYLKSLTQLGCNTSLRFRDNPSDGGGGKKRE